MKEAAIDMGIELKTVWRFHSDAGTEFAGALREWLKEYEVHQSNTGGYDPQANGLAESVIGEIIGGVRTLLHQSGAPIRLWSEAASHYVEILNRTKVKVHGFDQPIEPWLAESRRSGSSRPALAALPHDEDPKHWPPWGCRAIGLLPKAHREDKLSSLAVAGIFVGMDKVAVEGTRIAVLDKEYMKTTDPITEVIVCTTVRTKDDSFPLLDAVKPSDDDLEEFVKSVLPAETAGTAPAAAASPPEPPPRAAQPEATKAAEQEVDKAMEEIFSAPSAREAAAEASRAADRVIEARARELTGEERKRALSDDTSTSLRREKLLDDLPISIRKRFAEELGPEGAAGRRRIAMMMKRVLPSDEVLEKMMITGAASHAVRRPT